MATLSRNVLFIIIIVTIFIFIFINVINRNCRSNNPTVVTLTYF